jgi:long-chain acyl-CoA synthetase
MSLNLATFLADSARRLPDRTAVVHGDTRLRYGELDDRSRRLAAGLGRLGVRRGQHVALMLPNVPAFTLAYYAAHTLGAPVVPLNVQLTPDEIAFHLEDSDAVALVVWEPLVEKAAAAVDRVAKCRSLVVASSGDAEPGRAPSRSTVHARAPSRSTVHGRAPSRSTVQALVAENAPLVEAAATRPDDTAVILYTSGTTGRPKGAELTHLNLFHNADFCGTHLLPMSPETVTLAALPLFHSFGQTVLQNAVLRAGGTIVMMPRFDPGLALSLLQLHRVTLFAGVPTMFFSLLHHPKADQYDLSALRHCVSGGSAMPVDVMAAFDARYSVDILEGYGLSETSPIASFNVLDRPKKPGSIGIPIRDVEFRLADGDGRLVTEPMKPGEILIKGPNVMKGYYRREEATAEVLREGWFATGDVAYRDADGYYFMVDRKKDMIIRGGYNVYPREIEEVLYAHPAVAEAAVIGVADERYGEEVKAVLALRPSAAGSLTPEEVVGYCRSKLAAYKVPRIVEIRDTLPKTATGKILKRELRG